MAFLQLFNRSNAILRNAVGYLLTCFVLLTCKCLSLQSIAIATGRGAHP